MMPPKDPKKEKKDDEDKEKERKKNEIAKSEFFKKTEIKNNFENWKDGLYKLKGHLKQGLEHVKKAKYLKWDHLHGEVEVYDAAGNHLGGLDPQTLKLYKPAVIGRNIYNLIK